MGLLDTDIGYQLGLLAGGIWADNYRRRGEAKALRQQAAQDCSDAIQSFYALDPRPQEATPTILPPYNTLIQNLGQDTSQDHAANLGSHLGRIPTQTSHLDRIGAPHPHLTLGTNRRP